MSRALRSRSLEHLSGLAIWNCVPIVVTLEKDSRGLGFSVIDYQVGVLTQELEPPKKLALENKNSTLGNLFHSI